MKKALKRTTVYEPNENVKVTVASTPILDDENIEVGVKTAVTLKVTVFEKVEFSNDEQIADWFGAVDFTDPQLELGLGNIPAPENE